MNGLSGQSATLIRRNYVHGFTLIELLVVIAIICILAAILFPVFSQAKVAAKKAVSISNSKQIAIAMNLYVSDFDDVLPPLETGGSFAAIGPWPLLIQPYTKSWPLFRDPMDGQANDDRYISNCWFCSAPATRDEVNLMRGYQSNYGYNYAFLSPGIDPTPALPGNGDDRYTGTAMTSVGSPSETVLFVDGTTWAAGGGPPNCQPTLGGRFSEDAPAILDVAGFNYSTTTLWFLGWYFDPAHGCSWQRYGGAYPRYASKFNVTWIDTHVTTRDPLSLLRGVQYDTVNPQNSRVVDMDGYVWDLR